MNINATKQAKNTFGYPKHNPKLNNHRIPINPNLRIRIEDRKPKIERQRANEVKNRFVWTKHLSGRHNL